MMYVMEEQLIKKLRKGDEKAFRLLYDRHYVLLCRFANQILNNAALAEEVVDDTVELNEVSEETESTEQ